MSSRPQGHPGTPPRGQAADAPPDGVRSREITLRLGWFLLRHLNRVYRAFDGDFLLALVLGEIAHHNISHRFSVAQPPASQPETDWAAPELWSSLLPCNAFSLSNATGIPRETIRRKLAALLARGWLVRHPAGGVVMHRRVVEHFAGGFDREMLADLLDASAQIRAVLEREGRKGPPAGSAAAQEGGARVAGGRTRNRLGKPA